MGIQRINDYLAEKEDAFFQDVADAWNGSSVKQRVVGAVAVIGAVGLTIGGFNSLVNNTDVSEAGVTHFSTLAYGVPSNDVNVQWDGLNP